MEFLLTTQKIVDFGLRVQWILLIFGEVVYKNWLFRVHNLR